MRPAREGCGSICLHSPRCAGAGACGGADFGPGRAFSTAAAGCHVIRRQHPVLASFFLLSLDCGLPCLCEVCTRVFFYPTGFNLLRLAVCAVERPAPGVGHRVSVTSFYTQHTHARKYTGPPKENFCSPRRRGRECRGFLPDAQPWRLLRWTPTPVDPRTRAPLGWPSPFARPC